LLESRLRLHQISTDGPTRNDPNVVQKVDVYPKALYEKKSDLAAALLEGGLEVFEPFIK